MKLTQYSSNNRITALKTKTKTSNVTKQYHKHFHTVENSEIDIISWLQLINMIDLILIDSEIPDMHLKNQQQMWHPNR